MKSFYLQITKNCLIKNTILRLIGLVYSTAPNCFSNHIPIFGLSLEKTSSYQKDWRRKHVRCGFMINKQHGWGVKLQNTKRYIWHAVAQIQKPVYMQFAVTVNHIQRKKTTLLVHDDLMSEQTTVWLIHNCLVHSFSSFSSFCVIYNKWRKGHSNKMESGKIWSKSRRKTGTE